MPFQLTIDPWCARPVDDQTRHGLRAVDMDDLGLVTIHRKALFTQYAMGTAQQLADIRLAFRRKG